MTLDSQAKGKRAERAVAQYFTRRGWPEARRVVRTADRYAPDEGDVRLPGVTIEVKHYARPLTDAEVDTFMFKLCTQQRRADDVALLIERRQGVADPGRWWTHMNAGELAWLYGAPPWVRVTGSAIRLPLCDVVDLLIENGYAGRSCGG